MRLGVGVRQVAHGAVLRRLGRGEAEGQGGGVALLYLHFGKVDASPVHPGRRAGLEPAQGQAQCQQAGRQGVGGVHAVGAGGLDALAHDGAARQVRAGAEDGGADGEYRAGAQHHGGHAAILAADLRHLRLTQGQVFLPFQCVLHHLLIFPAVRLSPQGPDCGAFGTVEHAVLDAGAVRRTGHLAAQSVQLPHQMTLAGTADGGVAGHVAYRVQIDGEADGAHAQTRRRQRRLDAGMSGADDGDVKCSGVKLSHSISPIRSYLINRWYAVIIYGMDGKRHCANYQKIANTNCEICIKLGLQRG